MRSSLTAALSPFLLAAPFAGHAQTTAPTPRFFVGLAAYRSYYQPIESHAGVTGFPVPLQLTAGYQLRPRLAVQVGLAYSGSAYSFDYSGLSYSSGGLQSTYFSYASNSHLRTASVSVLARYTLTRNPAHRLQFDALGGLTLEYLHRTHQGTYVDSLNGYRNESPFDIHQTNSALLLTAGLGTRYRLSSHFDLTLDLLANHTLTTALYSAPGAGLTGSAALGLRYRFGRR